MIPTLMMLGLLCYCVFWFRYRSTGLRLRVTFDWRPLWLLLLAAVIYVVSTAVFQPAAQP